MKYTVLAAVVLAGCGSTLAPTSNVGAGPGPDTCNASAHQDLIGQDATTALVLPEPKRLFGPLDAITSDFDPARLNVKLDETDTIVAITCG